MSAVLKQTEFAALADKISSISAISVAIWLSVVAHAVILSLHFEPELKKLANQLPSLEVVLVNAKTKSVPDKNAVLAQASLDLSLIHI